MAIYPPFQLAPVCDLRVSPDLPACPFGARYLAEKQMSFPEVPNLPVRLPERFTNKKNTLRLVCPFGGLCTKTLSREIERRGMSRNIVRLEMTGSNIAPSNYWESGLIHHQSCLGKSELKSITHHGSSKPEKMRSLSHQPNVYVRPAYKRPSRHPSLRPGLFRLHLN